MSWLMNAVFASVDAFPRHMAITAGQGRSVGSHTHSPTHCTPTHAPCILNSPPTLIDTAAMGSVVSIPTALSVVLITGGILYGFLEKRPPPPAWNAPSFVTGTGSDAPAANNEKEKKKGKKKKGGKAEGAASKEQTAAPNVVSFPAVVPGAFDSAPATPPEPATTTTTKPKPKSKKKKTKKSTTSAAGSGSRTIPADQQSESSATAPESSVSRPRKSTGDDGAWTRVETKKRVNTSASANGNGKGSGKGEGVATSVTTATSSVAEDSPEDTKEGNENGNSTLR